MTATDDGISLLAAILAQPGDDTVRLAYADWLEEHGDGARAEFIRVQCELANNRRNWPGCLVPIKHLGRREQLERRERELLFQWNVRDEQSNGFSWSEPIHMLGIRNNGDEVCRFSRGFVSAVTCTAADWLKHRLAIVAAQPIERVTLTECYPVACSQDYANVVAALRHTTPGIEFTLIPRRGEP